MVPAVGPRQSETTVKLLNAPSGPMPAPRRYASVVNTPNQPHRVLALMALPLVLAIGCGKEDRPSGSDTAEPAPQAEAIPGRKGYEIPIPVREYWKETGNLKFEYEYRYNADGSFARNGWSRAYYGSGPLEREGSYLNNERIGLWTYYEPDGTVSRTEDRGGVAIWTAPDQSTPPPGTER